MENVSGVKMAPILLFVYNRLDHTKAVVDALKDCPEAKDSDLFIFSDAPKDNVAEEGVKEVRNYIRGIDGFKTVQIDEKSENWGTSKSQVYGITSMIEKCGRVIVLEDDIVVGPYFLRYMNLALERYQSCKTVYSVTGYSNLGDGEGKELPEYGFLPMISSWGWGTWKDRWKRLQTSFDSSDICKLFEAKFRRKFDQGYFYSDMLYRQYEAGHITWAAAWNWTAFTNGGLTLTPTKTMVNNIGMDGSGVHYTDKNGKNRIEDIQSHVYSDQFPEDTIAEKEYCDAVERALERKFLGNQGKVGKMRILLKTAVKWKIREIIFRWENFNGKSIKTVEVE